MSSLFRELGFLARRELAIFLDHESPRGADWKGLADKMKFTYAAILSLKGKSSPTLALLEKWEAMAGVDANLNNLITLVESLGCQEGVDILKKEKGRQVDYIDIPKSIGAGVHDISPKLHCPLTPYSSIDPSHIDPEEIRRIQQVQVSSAIDFNQLAEGLEIISITGSQSSSKELVSSLTEDWVRVPSPSSSQPDSLGPPTSQTNDTSENSLNQQYDVFLSFAEEDERFAEEVRQRLVENTKAKVFVPSSGLIDGQVFHQEVADMIREGCSRTVVILSPDYLESLWCGYEANLALMKSPDASSNTTIPIMYKQCEVPSFLSHLYYLDYPRFRDNREDCDEYFWNRLYKGVTLKR